jgi:G3E family GTPase
LEAIDKLSLNELCREPIIYSLVEGTTFDMFISNMKDFMLPSISHGNLIIINNCSMLEDEAREALIRNIESINRNAIIIAAQDISHLNSILEKKDIFSNGVIKKLRIKLLNGFRRR